MKLQTILEYVLEESLRVASLKTGFKQLLPGTNYVDAHQSLPVFGNRWGRGVLVNNNGKLDAIIGSGGSSHAELKKQMQPGENTAGTFYYGYDPKTSTLYFEYGSDTTFNFDNRVLTAIINSLKSSSGFFHNMIVG